MKLNLCFEFFFFKSDINSFFKAIKKSSLNKVLKWFLFLFLFKAFLGCASSIIVSAPTDLPQDNSGQENRNSKYKIDEDSRALLVHKNRSEITNASGITLHPQENKFYVITNNNNEIHVFDAGEGLQDHAVQTIFLKGWSESGIKNDHDLEDIVYLGDTAEGDSEFAFVNEGHPDAGAEVYICKMKSTWVEVKRQDCWRIHIDVPIKKKNKGPEGLAYDPINRVFFVAVEGNEKGKDLSITKFLRPELKFFSLDPTGTKGFVNVVPEPLFNADDRIGQLCPDLSAIYYSPKNQHLYLLTHVGERAIDIDLSGTIYGQFPLKQGLQFEGMTMDENQNLLFLSEPNLLFKFHRTP